MTIAAFILILLSALLHVTWNLVVKASRTGFVSYGVMGIPNVFLWAAGIFCVTPVAILQLPWPFWASALCAVTADALYGLALFSAYKRMDMSIAYPIMRSLPILFTMIITSCLHLGSALSVRAMAGMVIVFLGCVLMPQAKFSGIKWSDYVNRNMFMVLLIALGTTFYTIFDSQALKVLGGTAAAQGVSAPMLSLTYYGVRAVLLNAEIWGIVALTPSFRATVPECLRKHGWKLTGAGLCASGTYILVLIAMNFVTNVSYVQVFRQMALPFSVFAAVLFLKEKATWPKFVGVSLILLGLILTALPKKTSPVSAPPRVKSLEVTEEMLWEESVHSVNGEVLK